MSLIQNVRKTDEVKKPVLTKNMKSLYLLVAPTILLFLLVNIYPLLYSVWISFTNLSLSRPFDQITFIGLENFIQAFTDSMFLSSLFNTGLFVFLSVLFEFIFGLLLALALNKEGGAGRRLLSIFLLPMMLTPIIVGLLWRFMLNYDIGLVNFLISSIGLGRFPFLGVSSSALLSVIFVDVWQWTPFVLLFIYSGLQSLPIEFFEAAKIDGANSIKIFWYITLPSLKNTIFITLLIRGMDAIREYDKIFTMTYGGPGTSTETVSFYIYRQGFKIFNTSYASATSLILLVIVIVLTQFVVNRFKKRRD
jgi:multiple sugar transport system permease protein